MRIAVHGVPLTTAAAYADAAKGPAVLREAGLVDALGEAGHAVEDAGDVAVERVADDVEGDGGVLNRLQTEANLGRIEAALSDRVGRSDIDLLLGGECSFFPAAASALAATLAPEHGGSPAVLWLDAHGDLNTPATSPSGFVGGMALGLAAGLAPDVVEGAVDPARVVHVGARALDPGEVDHIEAGGIDALDPVAFREEGPAALAERAAGAGDWLYVHVDLDVLDPKVHGAVHFAEPGGLALDEVRDLVAAAAGTGRVRAVDIAHVLPGGGEAGVAVARALAEGLDG